MIRVALVWLILWPAAAPAAELIGAVTLTHSKPWFSGLSGLVMEGQGSRMLAVTDRGRWIVARVIRVDGRAVGLKDIRSAQIRDANGDPLRGPPADAEGLTRLPDGRLCVSFEGQARVACFAKIGAPAQPVPGAREFSGLEVNGGLEALASDAEGRLYTLPEDLPRGRLRSQGESPVWRWDGTRWDQALTLPAKNQFKPVGADIFEDHLYVLYRNFSPLGFASRLIRAPLAGGTADLLLNTGPGPYDNLEGISIWRNRDGDIVGSMISDNNQKEVQRTELVEFRLPEPPE